MTGKEKIQAFIDLIDKAHKELVIGNTVTLESYLPEKAGITLKEQAQILEMLSNDRQIINYTAQKDFESIDDIPDDVRAELVELETMIDYPLQYLLEDCANQITYTIEILESFDSHEVADKYSTEKTQESAESNIATLYLIEKVIKLTYNGVKITVYDMKSKNTDGFKVFESLMSHPETPLDKEELGVPNKRSAVKDIPKTIGFTGELKKAFFSVDSTRQTLMLHPQVSLTRDKAETIFALVNSKKVKK